MILTTTHMSHDVHLLATAIATLISFSQEDTMTLTKPYLQLPKP